MSYDIYLLNPKTKRAIELGGPHDLKGGTYAVGGTTEAWLNVTYNYSEFFYRMLGEKGIRTIYGVTGEESIPILRAAANALKGEPSDNYWDATEGNAKTALLDLIRLAKLAPYGVWDGD